MGLDVNRIATQDQMAGVTVAHVPPQAQAVAAATTEATKTDIPASATARKSDAKTKTLILAILDESYSMEIQKMEVIGGYNSFLATQQKVEEDEARLILIKFNDDISIAHPVVDIKLAPQLDNRRYKPSGRTALFDAVEEGIRIGEATAQMGERVLFLIMTDGEENVSKRGTADSTRLKMKEKESLGNWTFTYIGENAEGWVRRMGTAPGNARPYDHNNQRNNFEENSASASNFRRARDMQTKHFY